MSETNTRGEILLTALFDEGALDVPVHFAGKREDYPAAQLPADVGAFVASIEYHVEKGDGGADTDDTRQLIAIIRAQQEELRQTASFEQSVVSANRELGEMNAKLNDDNDALRERLARLEAAAREAYATHNEFRVSTEHSDAIAKLGELVKETCGER